MFLYKVLNPSVITNLLSKFACTELTSTNCSAVLELPPLHVLTVVIILFEILYLVKLTFSGFLKTANPLFLKTFSLTLNNYYAGFNSSLMVDVAYRFKTIYLFFYKNFLNFLKNLINATSKLPYKNYL